MKRPTTRVTDTHPSWSVALHAAAFGLAAMCGCTTTSPAGPFADVQGTIAERTGYHVEWRRLAPDIQDSLDRLLACELTADAAVQVALLSNRRLQAEYARLGVAQAELVQAGLLRNPIFSGTIRWAPGSQRMFDFSVVQDFLDVLLIPLEVSVAKSELESVKLEVTGRVIDLASDTKRAFYTYAANEELVGTWKSILLAAESSYEMAEQLRLAGNLTELEVLNEQAPYERAKLELARAESRRVTHRERLNRLMGLWGEATKWSAAEDLPPMPDSPVATEHIERRALASSLDLARAYAELEAAATRFRVMEVMQIVPRFELGASAEFEKEETFKLVEKRRRDGSEYELEEVPGSTEAWSGGEFSVALPLFDQGQAARAAGRSTIERLYEQYTALAIEIRSAAREAAFRAANARARARFHEEVFVPLRETITAETHLRYNAMFDGVFQLLRAKEREIDARRDHVEALREYWLANTDLEQLLMGRVPPEFRETMVSQCERQDMSGSRRARRGEAHD